MIAALLLAAQAATPAVRLPPAEPPARIVLSDCPPSTDEEVVVCGRADPQRLPLPGERGPPNRPMPSNPDVSGMGAMAAAAPVCAARQGGCQVGIDILGIATATGRLLGKLVDPQSCCERPGEATDAAMLIGDAVGGIARAFRKTPPKAVRIAIDLDAPPPSTAGRLSR